MTLANIRTRVSIILIGVLVLSLLGVWSGARVMGGIQQAKLASSAVQNLDLRVEALESGSLPDIASLQGRVSFVKSQFSTARGQLTPFLQVAPFLGWVPWVGAELRSSQDMLDLGDSLAQASQDLLAAVEIATFQSSQTNVQLLEGNRFNESVLRTVASGEPFFHSALLQLEQATTILEILEARDLPDSFRNMVNSARKMTTSMETFARTGLAASLLWENFFGYDKPRSHLLVAQNSDELRATGGFIPGTWVLTLDRGEISQLQFWDTGAVDDLDAGPPLPPEGAVTVAMGWRMAVPGRGKCKTSAKVGHI